MKTHQIIQDTYKYRYIQVLTSDDVVVRNFDVTNKSPKEVTEADCWLLQFIREDYHTTIIDTDTKLEEKPKKK